MYFADRRDAGRQLAARLAHLSDDPVVVLGLPRGGVPVAAEVARRIGAPLDVIVVRKLGVPYQPELAMGAIGEDGVRIVDPEIVATAGVSRSELAAVERRERDEVERRALRFRAGRPRRDLRGRTVVVVDDGVATGSTARAACQVVRRQGASRVVLAVPVAPSGWEARIGPDADECIALDTPEPFWAIGRFYADFSQTSDAEVVDLLAHAAEQVEPHSQGESTVRDRDVDVAVGDVLLRGDLTIPEGASGLVVFAHGSGSSRHSPRNRFVAAVLERAGLGTLLFDLLTPDEEHDRANVFDIELLAGRLIAATDCLRDQPGASQLPIGYFGASTGAAAALWAAAESGASIRAVVSRGGRPDLASARLGSVAAPTLLIVGGHDRTVLELNRQAQRQLTCESELAVIPGATHLFEEPGTLEAGAEAARNWFLDHLADEPDP